MSKPSFLIEIFGRRSLSITLVSLLLLAIIIAKVPSSVASESGDRQEAFRQIVQSYIQVGQEQYEKGSYEQAEETFLMAQKYREYLTSEERQQLSSLLEKSQTAISKRKKALEILLSVNEMIRQNELSKAKQQLEAIKDNEYLRADERAQVAQILGHIDTETNKVTASSEKTEQIKAESTEPQIPAGSHLKESDNSTNEQEDTVSLYYRSMDLYKAGQYEQAKKGFLKVIESGTIPPEMKQTIEGYLTKIDANSVGQIQQNPPAVSQPKPASSAVIQPQMIASENNAPIQSQNTYMDAIEQKRNTIRSYVNAVVKNAASKAQVYMNQSKFDLAKNEVQSAEIIVTENQMYLGDVLYNQYTDQLNALRENINNREKIQTQNEQEAKRTASIEAQRKYREQMEAERKSRVAELMKNAIEYQKQSLYEAALGQLQSLLALEPQNQQALVMKDFLEDTIYFKKQIEIEKEMNKQRADLLLQGDESTIPYARDLVYPKNWRDIIAKPTREPDKPVGLDETDAAVYEELEQKRDFSDLRPDMTFQEVLDIIKNKVEPPLQIRPNWRDLEDNANITRDTPSEMDPLTNVKIRSVLDALLAAVSPTGAEELQLRYIVEDGVIVIGTPETLPSNMVNRVYDISDLVGEPATLQGGMSMMSQMQYLSSYSGGGLGGYGGGLGGGIGGYGGGLGGGIGGIGGGIGGIGGGGYGGLGGGLGGGGYGGGLGGGGYGGLGGGGYGGLGGGGYGGGLGGGGYGGGGYGGGGYGGGGYGGGGYGGIGGGFGGGFGGGQASTYIAQDLITLVEQSIDPLSWYDLNEDADGAIYPFPTQQPKKLAVYNTPEVHSEIEKLLEALRKSLGHQVSIEARYLLVTENFLENIGLDVDFTLNLGGKWGIMTVDQASASDTTPDVSTKISGSLGAITPAAGITGGYGSILDDLQVAFLLRATQGRTDAKALVAPMVTVLSGETATFNVSDIISYVIPPSTTTTITPTGIGQAGTQTAVQPTVSALQVGIPLLVTPIITHDKKNVLLNINSQYQDVLRIRHHEVDYIDTNGDVQTFSTDVPETESTMISTRVSVPDSGTLLLGGQKVAADVKKEVGVPILGKIPVIGRLFRNTSTIKDQKILLILVKPTIILQEEREAEAIGAMANGSGS